MEGPCRNCPAYKLSIKSSITLDDVRLFDHKCAEHSLWADKTDSHSVINGMGADL